MTCQLGRSLASVVCIVVRVWLKRGLEADDVRRRSRTRNDLIDDVCAVCLIDAILKTRWSSDLILTHRARPMSFARIDLDISLIADHVLDDRLV